MKPLTSSAAWAVAASLLVPIVREGSMAAHYFPTPENKGVPTTISIPSMIEGDYIGPDGSLVHMVVVNREELFPALLLPVVPVWNWVASRADLAQNDLDAPVDFLFFMVTEQATGFGPLPDGLSVVSASIVGASGTEYPAQITPITDLASLPTSSPNLSSIEWDLSGFALTTGNFYLAMVTLPNSRELLPAPVASRESTWGRIKALYR